MGFSSRLFRYWINRRFNARGLQGLEEDVRVRQAKLARSSR
jgi:hypothetical protein